MNQQRYKSPILWGALAAIMLLILKLFGFEDAALQALPRAEAIFNAICALLAVLGIVNNPTDRKKW